jgi:hypothetical protein
LGKLGKAVESRGILSVDLRARGLPLNFDLYLVAGSLG